MIKIKKILPLMLVLVSCSQKHEKNVNADLSILADTTGKTVSQYEASHAGGGEMVEKKIVTSVGVTCEISSEGSALLNFTDSTGFIDAVVEGIGFPGDWKTYRFLEFVLSNPGTQPVNVSFDIYGARNRLPTAFVLEPGKKVEKRVSLLDLPLTARNIMLYEPNSVHIDAHASQKGFSLRIERISLVQTSDTVSEPVVDEIGQRVSTTWKGKLTGPEMLTHSLDEENARLDSLPLKKEYDQYGGLIMGNKGFSKTGFFHVEQIEGKWWFVTPDGNPFWSLGVTGVRTKYTHADVTIIKDREFLFSTLPSKEDKSIEYAFEGDCCFSFYCWNIIRKYGDLDKWSHMAMKRIRKWGMNTIGNWSEYALLLKADMPFTYSFRTTENEKLFMKKGLSDVFDPAWQQYADSVISGASVFRDNPYLLGYFIDNEGGWGKVDLLNIAPDNNYTRKEWEKLLKKKYQSMGALNKAWGTAFSSWEEIRNLRGSEIPSNDVFNNDYIALEEHYADQYFSFCRNTLKKYDPNHLYLGCRFTRQIKPDHVVKAAGRYCDVVTVNVYSLKPEREQMQEWYDKCGRPILIGEHHLPLQSERQLPPKYRAFTEDERIRYYPEYVFSWADMPFSLGCHWYQFVDQHITGRAGDGENQTVGLVDITDQPYQHMLEAIRIASDQFYNRHINSK